VAWIIAFSLFPFSLLFSTIIPCFYSLLFSFSSGFLPILFSTSRLVQLDTSTYFYTIVDRLCMCGRNRKNLFPVPRQESLNMVAGSKTFRGISYALPTSYNDGVSLSRTREPYQSNLHHQMCNHWRHDPQILKLCRTAQDCHEQGGRFDLRQRHP